VREREFGDFAKIRTKRKEIQQKKTTKENNKREQCCHWVGWSKEVVW